MDGRTQTESAGRVSRCLTELLRKQPFFGSLALRMPLKPDATRKTLAGDGQDIRFNPRWVADTGAAGIETAIARVVLACALKHHTRRGERDPERWQRASQLVTHALLRESGFALPPDAEVLEEMSVEAAYDRLPGPEEGGKNTTENASSPNAGDSAQSATDGQEDDADNGNPAEEDAPGNSQDAKDDANPASGEAPGNDQNQDSCDPSNGADASSGGASGCNDDSAENESANANAGPDAAADQSLENGSDPQGGCDSEGSPAPSSTPESHDPAGTGEIMDAPGKGEDASADPSPADLTAEEQAWDEAMHQAANLAKAEGKLPGAIAETVRGAHTARLDWRALLRRFLADSTKNDYSWSAPNHRFIDSGLYLPSLRAEGMDTLAVIIDTSGSLPTETLTDFWTELRGIASEIQPERVVLVQVDTRVRHTAEHTAFDLPEEIEIHGRGGTNFRPGFAWLEKQGITPAVCLYFTDMECTRYPQTEPDFEVLWVNWSDPPEDYYKQPWGERIDIGA